MVGTEFIDYLAKLQIGSYVGVEDFADKFNFLFTVVILMTCMCVVAVKQYLLKPISCYLATSVGGENLLEYVENYCWVQGTFATSVKVQLPENEEEWEAMEEQKVLYYQWVPFVLGLQCILFYLPRVLWQLICYNRTGTDLQHLVTSANQAVHSDTETRNKMVLHLSKTLEQMLFQHRVIRNGARAHIRNKIFKICSFCVVSKRLGTWLVFSYIILKFCYLFNAVGQVFLMQRFLGLGISGRSNYTFFGIQIAANILAGKEWESTMVFPRVTFCLARMKSLGSTNTVVAQCVLPANMLNEKIYIFLWFWIALAAILTFISIPIWFIRLVYQKSRTRFIKKFMKMGEVPMAEDKVLVRKFTRQFLRHDGVFLLKMISLNAGDLITSDIICQLWRIFRAKYRNVDFNDCDGADDGNTLAVRLDNAFDQGAQCTVAVKPSAPHETLIALTASKKLKKLMRQESLPSFN